MLEVATRCYPRWVRFNSAILEQFVTMGAAQAMQQLSTLQGELSGVKWRAVSASRSDLCAPSAPRAVGQGATSHGRNRRKCDEEQRKSASWEKAARVGASHHLKERSRW